MLHQGPQSLKYIHIFPSPHTNCPAIPNPTPAAIPAAAIQPTVCLAPEFEAPTTNVEVAVPKIAQLALWISKQASELKELQTLAALAAPKFCAVGATVIPAPAGATIVTPNESPCKLFVQAAKFR